MPPQDGHSSETPSSIPNSQIPPDTPPEPETPTLSPYHYVSFLVVLTGGLFFVALWLYFNTDISFYLAVRKVFRRLTRTFALTQLATILSAMVFVKYGLEPVIKAVRKVTKAQGPWEKSSEYYLLREIYKPMELLFLVAAGTTLAENFLPQVINIPKSVMNTWVRSTLSLMFVLAASRVVFNVKSRVVRESTWQLELKGDVTKQRRLEALDKLMSLGTLVVASIFGVRALGMDVNSVLAIGGVGGVAVGLAGREILENLFTGLIILSSNPFEVGEEVTFRPSNGQIVEGIVVDVGWYRTTIRSFEREIFIIPNSVFSRNVVLNITRKNREWRFWEFLHLRLEDLPKVTAVVSDIRKILRQDSRIIQKLHRRVFLDKISREDITIYVSFYVEAANRDAFMAVKQDLFLAFIDCVERNGAKLARNKLQLEMLQSLEPIGPPGQIVDVIPALPGPIIDAATSGDKPDKPPPSTSNGNSGEKPSTSNISPAAATNGGQQQTPPSSSSSPSKPPSSASASPAASNQSSSLRPSATGATSKQQAPSPQAVAKAIVESPSAVGKITAISPDAVVGGIQDGPPVLGSFDEHL